LNFVKISVDCDSQDTVSVTPFDSQLLCAATGVQTLFIITECTTLPKHKQNTSKPFGVL